MAQPGPFDTSGQSESLGDAIRRQAAAQSHAATATKQKKNGTAPKDPLSQLMDQIRGINVEATPLDMLMRQATGSAGAQFDPLIKQLQAQMSSTTDRGHANQAQAKQMYNDLATDISGEAGGIASQADQASQQAQQRYDGTQKELSDQYNDQAAQQAALYKQLGIQAAAPEASQQAGDDQAYFQQQSKTDEDSALAQLQSMKQGDLSYNQQSADNTRLAGVNTAQDIGAQLEQYLQNAGGQMAGLQSGREGAVQSMLAQLQQQDASRVQDQEKTQYDQLMDMFNLQLKMQDQAGKQGADPLFKGTNGPSGASNYLGQMYGSGDSFSSSAIMDAINDVMSSPDAVAGKYQSDTMKDQYGQPTTLDVTPEHLADLLRKRMQDGDPGTPLSNSSFSSSDINNAINALLAYQGKLK
jgi:hypothetical protein